MVRSSLLVKVVSRARTSAWDVQLLGEPFVDDSVLTVDSVGAVTNGVLSRIVFMLAEIVESKTKPEQRKRWWETPSIEARIFYYL